MDLEVLKQQVYCFNTSIAHTTKREKSPAGNIKARFMAARYNSGPENLYLYAPSIYFPLNIIHAADFARANKYINKYTCSPRRIYVANPIFPFFLSRQILTCSKNKGMIYAFSPNVHFHFNIYKLLGTPRRPRFVPHFCLDFFREKQRKEHNLLCRRCSLGAAKTKSHLRSNINFAAPKNALAVMERF